MAWSLNRAQIIGNMTRDPELRVTPSGQSVASFAVATNRRWKDQQGNQQEATEFHEVVAWGKLAEIVQQILHKGNRVYVEGRLQTRSWEGPDGGKRNRTEIIMENFVPLTPRAGAETLVDVPEAFPEEQKSQTPEAEEHEEKQAEKPEKKPRGKSKEEATPTDEINLEDIPF